MPEGTKVAECVKAVMRDDPDKSKEDAIQICQDRTGQSYETGEPIEGEE